MNARKPPVHRTGAGLRHAIRVWAWLYGQHEPVTACAVAAALGVPDRQARRTLARLAEVGAVERLGAVSAGQWSRPTALWVALDVVPA